MKKHGKSRLAMFVVGFLTDIVFCPWTWVPILLIIIIIARIPWKSIWRLFSPSLKSMTCGVEMELLEMPRAMEEEYVGYYVFQDPVCPSYPEMRTGLENRAEKLLAKRMWMMIGKPGYAFIDVVGDCRFMTEGSNELVEEWRIEKLRLVLWTYVYEGEFPGARLICQPYIFDVGLKSGWLPLNHVLRDFDAWVKVSLEDLPRFKLGNLCRPERLIDYDSLALD